MKDSDSRPGHAARPAKQDMRQQAEAIARGRSIRSPETVKELSPEGTIRNHSLAA